jgi:hypothetical protein
MRAKTALKYYFVSCIFSCFPRFLLWLNMSGAFREWEALPWSHKSQRNNIYTGNENNRGEQIGVMRKAFFQA